MQLEATAVQSAGMPTTPCNICGSTKFRIAFGNRTTNGLLPHCEGCDSVERHRMIYDVFSHLKPLLSKWRLLIFAPDRSIDRQWFLEFTPSMYGRLNSLDMMATGLPEGRYDLIMSNHVLEHVPDTFDAIAESLRVVGPEGVVQTTVPLPIRDWQTRDWGFPDPARNEHYRQFGADFPMLVRERFPGVSIIAVAWRDPVTDAHDVIYFFSRSAKTLETMGALMQRATIPVLRYA